MNLPFPEPDERRTSSRLNVVFVINAVITGGAESHTASLAADLVPFGFDSRIFAVKRGTRQLDGTPLLEPGQAISVLGRAKALAAVMDDSPCDLVVAVNQRPLAIAALARRFSRCKPPIAVIYHTTLLRNRKEELMQVGYNALFKRADLVVFISQNQRAYWQNRGMRPNHAVTILNGIDPLRFAPFSSDTRSEARAKLGFAPTDFVIGCCAMLRSEKNHLQLVDALATLRTGGVDAHALLVGDGPMRLAIETRARELGIAAHVIVAGLQADVRPFVAAFDVGALCSSSVETLSLSALETMGMGIPMVMSDVGGASEIVNGENGSIYPSGRLDDLVAGLATLVSPDRRAAAGTAARRTVESRFDVARMNRAYAEIFRTVGG